MAEKLYDLAVKTGTYMKDGEEKGRYENVGSIWEGDNGKYIVMKRTFNPAGVPFKEGSDSFFISMFEPREPDDKKAGGKPSQRTKGGSDDYGDRDHIPF